ncbi:MAG: D-glycero-beta-D-manno-heptose 1-phosphate adenylyltransferase [Candidatus Omnitrophota bacterium]
MNSAEKIVGVKTLKKKVASWRKKGKKIAFTNGCFDILHLGHVTYLQKAKNHNRILVIGLNSDASVKKIKGKNRPIVTQKARAGVLAALACVDYVTIFSEETPYDLIKNLKPDILIKGADWKHKGIIGADIVKSCGGKVEFIKFLDHFSTTNIINSLLKKCA